jgi:GDP-4-dehydro-6-deoxy-D-mannose reductase
MDKKRCLVTGAGGFTGRHLVNRLRVEESLWVAGTDLSPAATDGLDSNHVCDLTNAREVAELVASTRPQIVFHLAGLFGTAPEESMRRVNVEGLRHLCEVLSGYAVKTGSIVRLVVVGSAAELGRRGAASLPVSETATCLPESPYGRTKWAATQLALAQPVDGPLAVIVARPFNLVGPGLPEALSLGRFSRQIAEVLCGHIETLRCGPLNARRDYVDVRDAADAYIRLARSGRAGEIYNVCVGRSYRLADLLQRMIDRAGWPVQVISDQTRLNPSDLADIYGSYAKLHRETGWEPRIPIQESLADLVDEAIRNVNNSTQTAEAA